jgi:hypothetical protein
MAEVTVEVFKTSVAEPVQAEVILATLINSFPNIKTNFDLDDCDRVLRVEGEFVATEIIRLLKTKGHSCEVLG